MDQQHEDVATVLKTETARQFIILVFGIVGAVASVAVVRHVSNPDVASYYRMYLALWVKRYAERRVVFWERLADRAATAYNGEKL